ncbi:fimbria/pilus outer membrane usher protein [Brevundimonas goettingensis]|uniref:Fimbrial biogenesis outer membrane usher protein n=1 Tax=Brevundimonas goettingensis TaxID=2774190 RepID=A0A975GWU5_9CAUL|nr:fimbria/pilus outer membrane usher protein [Brevundimonas goettingensis]QTC92243.1 fimbrial biogenesis outer membrane usher protein [Brevundimonas goettingensis]
MFRSRHETALVSLLLTTMATAPTAWAQPVDPAPAARENALEIYLLDVSINHWPLGLVGRFVSDQGRLRIPAEQFDGLGFVLDAGLATPIQGEAWIWLDRVAGLSWTTDERAQTIDFTAAPRLLKTTELRVSPGIARIEARADWGAMLAWDAFGQWSPREDDPMFSRSFSVNLDTRLFSPVFTASSGGVISGGPQEEMRFTRLETRIDFDDPGHSRRLRLGDSFTVGPNWFRTLRFGGVQLRRDFGLRPDLVTTPVPTLTQEVSVPSTVDVFINGIQRYSDAVTPGPILLRDLPVVTGANTIRAVVTEQSGRRVEVDLPFYAGNSLLAKGKTDYSVAAGFPRENYNLNSNDYGPFFISGSGAYAASDTVTLRGFVSGSSDYWGGGLGATTAVGRFLVFDGAVLGSRAGGNDGFAVYAAASRMTARLNVSAAYVRSFDYVDLPGWFGYSRYVERLTGSLGYNFGSLGQMNLVYARELAENRTLTSVVSGTYGVDVGNRRRIRLSASAYADTGTGAWGGLFSLTMPLGQNVQGFAQQSWRDGRPDSEIQFQGQQFENRLDWQFYAAADQDDNAAVSADASWHGARAELFARATRINDSTGLQAEIAQSLVLMGGQAFLTSRIDDGFTVVDTAGTQGVRVALENRPVGRTNGSGRLLVTDLQSWLPNAISLDATDLPIDAALSDNTLLVAPRAGAGMVTRFEVTRARAAIIVLHTPDGETPPAGASVRLVGQDAEAPLGFGGEIYVRGLTLGENRLEVRWRGGGCAARFTVAESESALPRLGPYPCVP